MKKKSDESRCFWRRKAPDRFLLRPMGLSHLLFLTSSAECHVNSHQGCDRWTDSGVTTCCHWPASSPQPLGPTGTLYRYRIQLDLESSTSSYRKTMKQRHPIILVSLQHPPPGFCAQEPSFCSRLQLFSVFCRWNRVSGAPGRGDSASSFPHINFRVHVHVPHHSSTDLSSACPLHHFTETCLL